MPSIRNFDAHRRQWNSFCCFDIEFMSLSSMKHEATNFTESSNQACAVRESLFNALNTGDAIKSVKPYFGLGVNTALEDCLALDR